MLQFISNHFTALTYSFYAILFVSLSTWEYFAPRRPLTVSRFQRWTSNFSLYLISLILLTSLSTMTISNLAYLTWKNGWGLLNHLPLSPISNFILSLFLLDFEVYCLHVLYHKIPLAWRFHRVHHLDLDLDSSSGLLFHPFESLASFLFRQPFILLAGPSYIAVLFFDSLFIIALLLTHSNISLFPALDRFLRLFFVTPDMHRIHHSTGWDESNSNYGFFLSWWDRLFQTYRRKPRIPQEKLILGLSEFQSPYYLGLTRLLLFPFLKKRIDGNAK